MKYPEFFKTLWYEIFIVAFAVYLASLGVESVSRGLIASVVQLNVLFLICVVSGLVTLSYPPQTVQKKSWFDYVFVVAIAILAGVFSYQTIKAENSIAFLLALAVGIGTLLFLLSLRNSAFSEPSKS